MRSFSLFVVALAASPLLSGCVGAPRLAPSPQAAITRAAPTPEGTLSLEAAWARADAHHPELAALRQAARSVNLAPGPEPLQIVSRWFDGDTRDLAVEGELLSLFGTGPRAARRRLAFAQRCLLLAQVQTRQVEIAGDLAEAFARVQALDALEDPGGAFDLTSYEEAGLVAGGIQAAARSTLEEAAAERDLRRVLRREAMRQIEELVGAAPAPIGVSASFAVAPSLMWQDALAQPVALDLVARVHPELRESLAAYRVADRALRAAVSEQLPGVILRLGGDLSLDAPLQLLRVRLPLGAPAEARAAQGERLRAFEAFRAVAHRVRHDIAEAALAREARAAELRGAEAALRAAGSLREAALGRVDTDAAAVAGAVLALAQEVQAARRVRAAALAEAEADVGAARARGWPFPLMLAPHMRGFGGR